MTYEQALLLAEKFNLQLAAKVKTPEPLEYFSQYLVYVLYYLYQTDFATKDYNYILIPKSYETTWEGLGYEDKMKACQASAYTNNQLNVTPSLDFETVFYEKLESL